MAKQKILIFVGILLLLLIAGAFYFLIKKDSAVRVDTPIPNTPLTDKQIEAKNFETLNSFQAPLNQKSEAEAKKDLNRVSPPKEIQKRTEEQSTQDLLNITR